MKTKNAEFEVIAKPSGFAGNAGFRTHFSRICGQDVCAARGFAIPSFVDKYILFPNPSDIRYGRVRLLLAPGKAE